MTDQQTLSQDPAPRPGRGRRILRQIADYVLIIVGAGLNAVSINTLLLPNEVVAGGVTGLAVIADLTLPIPFSVGLLAMNVPLVLLQWRFLGGAGSVLRTIVGVAALALLTELLGAHLPPITHDRLLVVVYGGVLGGVGLALVFMGRGTTGGGDILGRLCHKFFGWSIGRTMLGVNVLVYGLAGLLFGLEPAMLALLLSYVLSHTLDAVLHGMSSSRVVWIVSERAGIVAAAITQELGRGLTVVPAQGGHSGRDKSMLYVVVPRSGIQRLKRQVLREDPDAFITVMTPRESVGGFQVANPQ